MKTILPGHKGTRIAYIVASTLLVLVCLGVLFIGWQIWKTSQPKLPLYPSAQEVDIRENDEIADSTGKVKAAVYMLSFRTFDEPEMVLAFYRDTLPRQGWQLERIDKYGGLIYRRTQEGSSRATALTVSFGSGEQPKPIYVTLTMGDYEEMQRVHGLGR